MKKAVYLILALVFCGVFFSCEEPKEPKEEKKEIKYSISSVGSLIFEDIYVYEFDDSNNQLRKHYIFMIADEDREIIAHPNASRVELFYIFNSNDLPKYMYGTFSVSDSDTERFYLFDGIEISEEEYNQRISQK